MSIILSAQEVFRAFKGLGDNAKTKFLVLLDKDPEDFLDQFMEREFDGIQRSQMELVAKINSLTDQVNKLQAENAAIKRRSKVRMTQAERKAKIAELSADGWSAADIEKQMANYGEPITAGAIRVVLHRLRKGK